MTTKEKEIQLNIFMPEPNARHPKFRKKAAIYAVNHETDETFKLPVQMDAFEARVGTKRNHSIFQGFDFIVKARNPAYDDLFTSAFQMYVQNNSASAGYKNSKRASFFEDIPNFFELNTREEKALWIAVGSFSFETSEDEGSVSAVPVTTLDEFWCRNLGSACTAIKKRCHEIWTGTAEDIGRKLLERFSFILELDSDFVNDFDTLSRRVKDIIRANTKELRKGAPLTQKDLEDEQIEYKYDSFIWTDVILNSEGSELFDFESYASCYLENCLAKFAPDLSCILSWRKPPVFVLKYDKSIWKRDYGD